MTEYGNSRCCGRRRRVQAKRRRRRLVVKKLSLFCVCVIVAVLAGVLRANHLPLAAQEAPARILPPPVAGSGHNTGASGTVGNDANDGGGKSETPWQLILVNRWHSIPEGYDVELTEVENGQRVDARIAPSLREMLEAARRDGVHAVLVSGYRTAEEQQRLLDEKTAAYQAEGLSGEAAAANAEAWVAKPGTSEHQLGIAADINADGIHSTGEEVYRWLEENSHAFGFIRRYPPGKTGLTGVEGEPWHYRYVGAQAAAEMHGRGVCLEEYLAAQ